MQRFVLISLLLGGLINAYAQPKLDSLSLGAGYADQVWWSFDGGEQARASQTGWDLAFGTGGGAANILMNTGKGNSVWVYPMGDTADWATVDTMGLDSWSPLYNSTQSWSLGALNAGYDPNDQLDLGWGTYSFITHFVTGDSVFVMQNAAGAFKKLWIEQLASGTYTFRYGNLDGTNDTTVSLVKSDFTGKNFGYFSFDTDATLDPEPASADWDLLFTRYTDYAPTPYPVSGVLSNIHTGVSQVYPVDDVETFADYNAAPFDSAINHIGWDWKSFSFMTGWSLQDSMVYFVKTQHDAIYKLVFTDFGGSSSGNFYFTHEEIRATGLDVTQNSIVGVFPNPVTDSHLSIHADLAGGNQSVRILDLQGRLLQHNEFTFAPGLQRIDLQLPDLASGMYLVELIQNQSRQTSRFLVK
ncbi:MAG: T9SS type A sorting domain-containing protein [Bacteroidota bacterium]